MMTDAEMLAAIKIADAARQFVAVADKILADAAKSDTVAVVGLSDPPTRLAVFDTVADAEEFVTKLYGHEDGRYYIDYPVDRTVL